MIGLGIGVGRTPSSGGAAPFVGLLDTYTGAAAAYSLRKLRNAYSGNAIQVRRSSDGATQNIGFTGTGDLDTATLSSFCAGTNGYITTWYDQSTNAAHATQPMALQQPQIVSAGNIILVGGKPAIDFSVGSLPTTLVANLISTNQYWTAFGVIKPNDYSANISYTYGRWISVGTLGTQDYSNTSSFLGFVTHMASYGSTPPSAVTGYNTQFTSNTFTFGTRYIVNSLKTGNTIKSGLNNVLNAGLTQAGQLNANGLAIGSNISWTPEVNSNFFGTIQEVVYYPLDQSAVLSTINLNLNNYYGVY